MVPLALVLMVWWVFRSDRCLGSEISNAWNTWYPPVVEYEVPPPGAPGAVVVENPYGISTCHYDPDAKHYVVTFSTLALISLFIGLLCAWNFQQRAEVRAAAITFGTALPALLFDVLAYFPRHLEFFVNEGLRPLALTALILLVLAVAAGALAWLAARLTLRWRPRG